MKKTSLLLQLCMSIVFAITSVQAFINPADVLVTKSGPETARLGEKITYTIEVTNKGKAEICDLELQDFFIPCSCESPFIDAKDESDLKFEFFPTIDGFCAKSDCCLKPGESFKICVRMRACFAEHSDDVTVQQDNRILTNFVHFKGKQGCKEISGCATVETHVGSCIDSELAVRIEPIPAVHCKKDTLTSPIENSIVYVCPGGEVNLDSDVHGKCGTVEYCWYRAAVPTPTGELPEKIALENGKPAGFACERVGSKSKLSDCIPSDACPFGAIPKEKESEEKEIIERLCPIAYPQFMYVLVIKDTCTGCLAMSNPIFAIPLQCADLEISKEIVKQDGDKTIFALTVTNNGPCIAFPGSFVVQDCMRKDLKLRNVCAGEGWKTRIINCAKDQQCLQACFEQFLPVGSTTSAIEVEVKSHDETTNTATVWTVCNDQFDCNLANNSACAKIKRKRK